MKSEIRKQLNKKLKDINFILSQIDETVIDIEPEDYAKLQAHKENILAKIEELAIICEQNDLTYNNIQTELGDFAFSLLKTKHVPFLRPLLGKFPCLAFAEHEGQTFIDYAVSNVCTEGLFVVDALLEILETPSSKHLIERYGNPLEKGVDTPIKNFVLRLTYMHEPATVRDNITMLGRMLNTVQHKVGLPEELAKENPKINETVSEQTAGQILAVYAAHHAQQEAAVARQNAILHGLLPLFYKECEKDNQNEYSPNKALRQNGVAAIARYIAGYTQVKDWLEPQDKQSGNPSTLHG